MDAALRTEIVACLMRAQRLADEASALVACPDEFEAESAAHLARQRADLGRAIESCAQDRDLGAAADRAAEPVWQCAGAILALDLDNGEVMADRIEVIGDRVRELARRVGAGRSVAASETVCNDEPFARPGMVQPHLLLRCKVPSLSGA